MTCLYISHLFLPSCIQLLLRLSSNLASRSSKFCRYDTRRQHAWVCQSRTSSWARTSCEFPHLNTKHINCTLEHLLCGHKLQSLMQSPVVCKIQARKTPFESLPFKESTSLKVKGPLLDVGCLIAIWLWDRYVHLDLLLPRFLRVRRFINTRGLFDLGWSHNCDSPIFFSFSQAAEMLSCHRAWRGGLWRQCSATLQRRSFSKATYPGISKHQVCNSVDGLWW